MYVHVDIVLVKIVQQYTARRAFWHRPLSQVSRAGGQNDRLQNTINVPLSYQIALKDD